MTNKEYARMEEYIAKTQKQRQTKMIVPYRDIVSWGSHISKEVVLTGYQNGIGKTLRYLDVDWNVDSVTVVGEEIHISLNKDTIK